MDYNQKDFFQFPYPYMYPLQGLYMMGNDSERDLEYLQQMYPAEAREMQHLVEEECDRLEYEGSMMYDEYPDRLSLLRKSQEVWEQAQKRENFGENSPDWEQIRDLTGVLLLQEMLVRRKKKRRR